MEEVQAAMKPNDIGITRAEIDLTMKRTELMVRQNEATINLLGRVLNELQVISQLLAMRR